jgi:transcription elongation factor
MGEPRASGGCMDSHVVSYASLQKNIHSLFAENAACIIKNPADTFKCIQLHAHRVNKCKYTVNLKGSLVAKNLRGEKNA